MYLEINNVNYEVVVNRKDNKNTYIRFDGNKIVVNTSKSTSERALKKILNQNFIQIKAMVDKGVKRLENESKFYYLGLEYDIIIVPTLSEIKFGDGAILVKDEKTLNKFLVKKTNEIVEERFEHIYSIFEEKIPKYRLRLRKMKTRWGVCNKSSKTITINSNLIRYNKSVIDYVIIHELAHLIHFDHSKSFWNLVEKYDKDYKIHRKALKGL